MAELEKPASIWAYVKAPDGRIVRMFLGHSPYIGRPIILHEGKLCEVVGIEHEPLREVDQEEAWH